MTDQSKLAMEDKKVKAIKKKKTDHPVKKKTGEETMVKKAKIKQSRQAEEKAKKEEKIAELQDKYIRLSADFDNYRKRTLKEKIELTKSANTDILLNLLPIMDDFERALTSMEGAKDCKAMKEGIDLIYNKFTEFLKFSGVKEIDAMHEEFDTDLHEAVTKIPAPKKKLKGKVLEVIQKGYWLNEKIIRYPKVVIGE